METKKVAKEYLQKDILRTIFQMRMQFTASSGRHSVLERPFSETNGRPFFS